MVSVVASKELDRGFELGFSQTKDYQIGSEYVSDCCLTPIQQFVSYIMAGTS